MTSDDRVIMMVSRIWFVSLRHQALIWTNPDALSIGPFRTNYSETVTKVHKGPFRTMHFIETYAKYRPFCSDLKVLTHCDLVTSYGDKDLGQHWLDNGLLTDGTKPLPEPRLTDHQWSPVTFILGQFHMRCLNLQLLKSVWKLHIWNFIQNSPGANE